MATVAASGYGVSRARPWRRFLVINVRIIVVAAVLLLLVRAVLPVYIRRYVNRTLDRIPEYDGSIGDVDLALWRGAYTIDDIKLLKTTGRVPVPFFSCDRADFSVQWSELFSGKIVGELYVENGELNFVNGPNRGQSQTEIDAEWLDAVKDLFPLRINRFEVTNGEVHYRDFHSEPKIDVVLTDLAVVGRNLSNSRQPTRGAAARISARGRVENTAPISIETSLDPSASKPTFDLDLKLDKLPATRLNDFFRAYGGFDAEGGEIGIYSEVAAAKGAIRGYVKPLLHDVELIELEQDVDNPLQAVWESMVAIFAELFQNQRRDQVATEIPFSGRLDDVDVGAWSAFLGILRNAFIEGLDAEVDQSISLSDLKDEE